MEPCRRGPGPGLESAARARTRALKHVSPGSAPPPPPGHQGPLCVYNLRPGKSAGPSRAGRWRNQKGLCCTGRGGRVCFSGRVWVPSPRDARLVPNRPAPGLPLPRGGLDPWGVSTLFPAAPRPPRPPASLPKFAALLLHPSQPLWPGEPTRSREEPPRTKWAREGKEVGAAAPPCKKFRETPRTPPPSLFRLIAHWRRQWQPTPVLLPGKSHRRRSLVGCSPWGLEQSDMSERFHFHFSRSCIGEGHGNPLQCSCLENPRDGGAW